MLIEILDMGYSDHLAQFLCVKSRKLPKGPLMTYTRYFTDINVEEFKYLMHKETWNEVLECNEPNNSFNRLTPKDPYMGCSAPLTSKHCILYIYSTNTCTEYFKHALYSPFFLFKMQFIS